MTLKRIAPGRVTLVFGIIVLVGAVTIFSYYRKSTDLATQLNISQDRATNLNSSLKTTEIKLASTSAELDKVLHEDQRVRNNVLEATISAIEKTYKGTVDTYELLVKLREQTTKTADYDKAFADIMVTLSKRDYASSEAKIAKLKSDIAKKQAEIASTFQIPANVQQINAAPGNGYRRQSVATSVGTFLVDVIAADLNSTKVIVDTASDSDCRDNCPVMNLGDYAARSGAFAGINGPYFCPASYPSCAGKTNSFDTLLMNKNKHYFNSDNNVYSVVPAVIFQGNSARFVGRSLEWGRDTGPDSVIANQPLMVNDGNVVFGGDSEVKRSGRGPRSFIGATGNTAYMGIVYNSNVAEAAIVVQTMGIKGALNLDSGGSTALWSNGRYLAGPGRALPFGILFVRK